ncbi:hypothetical protein D3C87_2081510 [compost metagenome]
MFRTRQFSGALGENITSEAPVQQIVAHRLAHDRVADLREELSALTCELEGVHAVEQAC